jgi:hypothetical protein
MKGTAVYSIEQQAIEKQAIIKLSFKGKQASMQACLSAGIVEHLCTHH